MSEDRNIVAQNKIFEDVVKKELASLPTPIHFKQTVATISGAIPAKITSTDPRHLKEGTHGLTDAQVSRYVQIREDLEKSYRTFPAQKYEMTVTSAHEVGWDVNSRTRNMRKSAMTHFRPKKSSEISKFAESFQRINGNSPFNRNHRERKVEG
mmetsp:Transcript_15942/g.32546  ORF Transcript_15942/g.32546 Transcript_15942/m.32546 type:complete len:153 (+) Transcript_15942:141-599(+)